MVDEVVRGRGGDGKDMTRAFVRRVIDFIQS